MKKSNNIEQRTGSAPEIHMDTESSEKTGYLSGYAALYNTEYRYHITDEQGHKIQIREVIRPGAFTQELIERSDVRATLNHDANHVMARSKRGQGTLTLEADERGLRFSFVPSDDFGHIVRSVQRNDIDQCSYKYIPHEERVSAIDDTTILREVMSFDELYDIAIVTYPAYEETSVGFEMRSKVQELLQPKDPVDTPMEDWMIESEERDREIQLLEILS